jgi:hypothetical protein
MFPNTEIRNQSAQPLPHQQGDRIQNPERPDTVLQLSATLACISQLQANASLLEVWVEPPTRRLPQETV